MRYFTSFFISFLLFCLLIAGCGTDATPPALQDGSFSKVTFVPSINIETLNSNGSLLLAGSTKGAYKKRLNRPEKAWRFSGLNIDSAKVVDFTLLSEQNILAVVMYDNFNPENPMLFTSEDIGQIWSPDFSTEIKSVDQFAISEIEKDPINPNNLYVYRAHIIRSKDGGKSWMLSFNQGFGPQFMLVPMAHPNQIWAGGTTTIFSPYLAKSEDGGDSWTLLNDNFYFNTDATVHDVVIHPDDSDQVLAGVSGSVSPARVIRKSTDGGQTWKTVFEGINTYTLTHSARDPEVVYASGRNPEGTLFFMVSGDFGDTWEQVTLPESPPDILVKDMISVMEGDHEMLYFGTNKGIYSYAFEE